MYAELRCRTHYSFLRGASHPSELVIQAGALGLSGLAITDRNGVYGIPKAFVAAKELPDFKLIVGSELTLENQAHLFLLAKNRKGYGVMCRLLTESHKDKEKGMAALDWTRLTRILSEYGSEDLFVITEDLPLDESEAEKNSGFYGDLKDLFRENLFFPLSRVLDGHDARRTRTARAFSQRFGIPLIATNDVHFHVPPRRLMHDVLSSIREGKPMYEMGTGLFPNAERYLKSPAQMQKLFSDLPDAVARTVEIAQDCRFSPAELRYQYPSEWIPEGETAQSHLETLVWQGAAWRYQDNEKIPDDVRKQLVHELDLTKQLSFADYFLTIWEIVDFAKKRQILCQGRGSAANSAICYCLGVTAIDPVKMNLLFERFISAERNEPPDIDVDFEHERREEVIQHIYEKYGRHRAGMVANVICYRSKSSRREVSKAFGIDPDSPELEEILAKNPMAQKLIEEIEGFPRHLGIHSGGFTLSKDPLIETVPIEPARMENRTVVQWDKDDLACIGLLKVDVLSLGMLTALRKTFDLVRPKKQLTLASVPADDVETYQMIRRGETVGVFQIESRAQMGMLKRLLPKNFYDLVIQIAIVRPGPIVGEMVHPYLRRRRGEEAIDIPHPDLHPILDRTLGVPLFQEQVMKISIVLAGFTPGEADELRRAINAWKSKGSIEKMGLKLMKGLLAAGLKKEFVGRIFKQIQGFAEYGFPESHSASFATLAYASSYLKCHFPGEFACALINSQPMGFYSSHTIVEEARRQGVRVLPVDINHSEWDCDWVKDVDGVEALRIGLRVVSGLNQALAQELVETRKKKPFVSLMDFLSRTKLSQQCLQSFAMGEAFVCFGLNQRDSLWEILAYRILTRPSSGKSNTQMNLFENFGAISSEDSGERVSFPALNDFQAIRSDYQVYGLSTRGHPMKELRKYFHGVPKTTTGFVKAAAIGRVLKIAGLVIARQRPPNAKGTCFATLEDEEGFIDLILHNDTFEKYREVLVDQPFIVAAGKVQRDGAATSILVHHLEAVAEGSIDVRVKAYNFH